jgi:hypothetical protein
MDHSCFVCDQQLAVDRGRCSSCAALQHLMLVERSGWEVQSQDTRLKPTSAAQVAEWAGSAKIHHSSHVYHSSLGRWVEIGEFQRLYKYASRTSTPYKAWRWRVANDSRHGGMAGWGLIVITAVVTLVATFGGVFLFPPGRYPQIVLALPGLMVGAGFFFATAPLFFRLQRRPPALQVE